MESNPRAVFERLFGDSDSTDRASRLARIQQDRSVLDSLRESVSDLEKLKATPDGDGTLLDHVMLIYGSGMSNSNQHVPHKLPILVAGGGAGQLQGGRHLTFPEGTPLTNLYLTVLNKVGVPVERVGDSTGQLEHLAGV